MTLALLIGALALPGCATTGAGSDPARTRPADEISEQAAAAYEQQDWAAAEAY
ncbi:MAG: hypothetical protein HKO62_00360, partial [Gammaproteobacteria bacterium]|nr:hypothetical protein [Gammaproteobacteria bacterium]